MQIFLIMALTREKKEEIVDDIRQKVSDQTVVYFVNYKGMKARQIESLRKRLKENEANIMVVKKTLAKIAFDKENIDFDPEELDGELAFVFGFGDIVTPAKVISEFAKDYSIEILGALLEGSALEANKVEELAELPTKEQLRAQLVSTIASPLTGFVGVLEGNIKGLLTVLKKQSEKDN
ncbi:MAG: 50S ribosomal protein L10 [Patescibacteria group bacterium]